MPRTTEQIAADHAVASVFEQEVADVLRGMTEISTHFSAHNAPDICITPLKAWLELKIKVNPLGKKWLKHCSGHPESTFIIDEVTIRRLVKFDGDVWFLMKDVPSGTLVVASLYELVVAHRDRVVRDGRGKLLYDMTDFRTIGSIAEVLDVIEHDLDRKVPIHVDPSAINLGTRNVGVV